MTTEAWKALIERGAKTFGYERIEWHELPADEQVECNWVMRGGVVFAIDRERRIFATGHRGVLS